MLNSKELAAVQVGDVINSGIFVFEGLPDEEFLTFTATRVDKKVVEFEVTYFGILIGRWVASSQSDGKVAWVDQGKAAAALNKGVLL